MNMSIDGNCGCLEPVDKDTVSSLTPNRGELQQLIHALRHFATILVKQDPRDFLDSPCFRIVETHWLDESRDSPGICSGQALDIGEPGEEPGGSESCNRILGSMRQHGRNQDSERITISRIANLLQSRGIILSGLVNPDSVVEARQTLSNAFLGVKIHACSVGVARVQTDTQSIFLFHSVYDLSNVGKVGAHAVPLSCHVLQQYPGILLDALYSHVQRVSDSLQANIPPHS